MQCANHDFLVWATVVLISTIALLTLFGSGTTIWNWIIEHPRTICWSVLGYIIAGAFWGVIKWYFYCTNIKDEYNDIKRDWLQGKQIEGEKIPKDRLQDWKVYLFSYHDNWIKREEVKTPAPSEREYKYTLTCKPKVWENKGRVTRWMAYWIFSLIWTLLDDIVIKIFHHIQRCLTGLMNRITDFVFSDIDEDFKE